MLRKLLAMLVWSPVTRSTLALMEALEAILSAPLTSGREWRSPSSVAASVIASIAMTRLEPMPPMFSTDLLVDWSVRR